MVHEKDQDGSKCQENTFFVLFLFYVHFFDIFVRYKVVDKKKFNKCCLITFFLRCIWKKLYEKKCSSGTWIHPDPSHGPSMFDLTKKNYKIYFDKLLFIYNFYFTKKSIKSIKQKLKHFFIFSPYLPGIMVHPVASYTLLNFGLRKKKTKQDLFSF